MEAPTRLTYQAVLAGRWASAPQRWPYRGWSHKHRLCSPPWRSRGQGACGGACPARSAAGSFGPAHNKHTHHDVTYKELHTIKLSAKQNLIKKKRGLKETPCLVEVGSDHSVQYPLTVRSVHHDEGWHLWATTQHSSNCITHLIAFFSLFWGKTVVQKQENKSYTKHVNQ